MAKAEDNETSEQKKSILAAPRTPGMPCGGKSPVPYDQQATPPDDARLPAGSQKEQYSKLLLEAKNACTVDLNAVLQKHGFNMIAIPQVTVMPDGTPKFSATFDLIPTP
jgi:hypothetical protein